MCAVDWSRGEQSSRRDPLILLWTGSVDRPHGDDEGQNVHQCLRKIKLKILTRESKTRDQRMGSFEIFAGGEAEVIAEDSEL
jgi:hypothetical protein